MHHVDPAETLFIQSALEQLQGCIAPVLLDHKQADVRLIASAHHSQAISPSGGHGLFRHHMPAMTGSHDCLLGMQAGRRAQRHKVTLGLAQHGFVIIIAGHMPGIHMLFQHIGVIIAYGHKLEVIGVLCNGLKMVFCYPPTADHRHCNGALLYTGKHDHPPERTVPSPSSPTQPCCRAGLP